MTREMNVMPTRLNVNASFPADVLGQEPLRAILSMQDLRSFPEFTAESNVAARNCFLLVANREWESVWSFSAMAYNAARFHQHHQADRIRFETWSGAVANDAIVLLLTSFLNVDLVVFDPLHHLALGRHELLLTIRKLLHELLLALASLFAALLFLFSLSSPLLRLSLSLVWPQLLSDLVDVASARFIGSRDLT